MLVLDISSSTDSVIRRKGDDAVFLRQGDKSLRLGDREIRALEYDKNQRLFKDEVSRQATIQDVDQEVVNRYRQALGTDASGEQVLKSRGFLIGGYLTNAGILLFSENPSRFMPQARVRVGKITTRELSSLIGKGLTLSSKTLRGLAAKGILEWHGNSKNDPSQFYSLPK